MFPTLAPIWFPHCPAWRCTISRILSVCVLSVCTKSVSTSMSSVSACDPTTTADVRFIPRFGYVSSLSKTLRVSKTLRKHPRKI